MRQAISYLLTYYFQDPVVELWEEVLVKFREKTIHFRKKISIFLYYYQYYFLIS